MTSPPYALLRKSQYGGVAADHYVEWFLPIAEELKRVLKPTGSFVLNIKETTHKGLMQTYVYELVLALCAHEWLWMDEYIWHKLNPMPFSPNQKLRLKNGWERCLHFSRNRPFSFYPDAVKEPAKSPPHIRDRQIAEALLHGKRVRSASGSKHDWRKNKMYSDSVYPSNVIALEFPSEGGIHPTQKPVALFEYLIRTYTQPGDLVLDPTWDRVLPPWLLSTRIAITY
jgi:site-specific DNA-methyltransferase (adenine-specific)